MSNGYLVEVKEDVIPVRWKIIACAKDVCVREHGFADTKEDAFRNAEKCYRSFAKAVELMKETSRNGKLF